MKRISLTQGKFALVDDEDFERLNQYKWQFDYYPKRSVRIPGSRKLKRISMAKAILQTETLVDHKDGNVLDCQKHNLRLCTKLTNGQNKRKQKRKLTSKYKGVYFEARKKRWRARIQTQDIFGQAFKKSLGMYSTEREAAEAYDEAARYYFEEFAALNFPREGEVACG